MHPNRSFRSHNDHHKEVQLANLTFSAVEVFREEVRQRPHRIPY
ncbi:hypothetical protein ACWDBC_30045 [Streptomyces parvus]|nr:hypothetical protein [Streptomyces sp. CS149]